MTETINFYSLYECYSDEVRNGFFVSETMKHYWAAQLGVLAEIDKICRRHECNWFADSGTLIGCVRHKGYIPWDDDLDIAMLRDDLEKFLQYARKELPEGYVILSAEDNDDYQYPFCRITNSRTINSNSDFLSANYGVNAIIKVDQFHPFR